MQVFGIVCVCLCCSAQPAVTAVGSAVHEPVISKRIAPLPKLANIIQQALEPHQPAAPAMPRAAAQRLQTAKQIVDRMLSDHKVLTVRTAVSDADHQPIDVLMDGIEDEFVAQPAPRRQRPSSGSPSTDPMSPPASIVDLSPSNSNQFVMPDPTDDQFITDPRPISIDFQDQLKTTQSAVETEVETGEQKTVQTEVEPLSTASQPLPTTTEAIEEPLTEPVNSSRLTAEISDCHLDEAPTTFPSTIQTTEDTELMEVTSDWSSLNQSTRDAILMLVQADRISRQ